MVPSELYRICQAPRHRKKMEWVRYPFPREGVELLEWLSSLSGRWRQFRPDIIVARYVNKWVEGTNEKTFVLSLCDKRRPIAQKSHLIRCRTAPNMRAPRSTYNTCAGHSIMLVDCFAVIAQMAHQSPTPLGPYYMRTRCKNTENAEVRDV